jgi:hypothetical protein
VAGDLRRLGHWHCAGSSLEIAAFGLVHVQLIVEQNA